MLKIVPRHSQRDSLCAQTRRWANSGSLQSTTKTVSINKTQPTNRSQETSVLCQLVSFSKSMRRTRSKLAFARSPPFLKNE